MQDNAHQQVDQVEASAGALHGGMRLRIRVDDADVPVRDFGSYLTFADRMYGRITPRGLASYAQKREEHLSISNVQVGSLELVIQEVLRQSPYLIGVYLVLKFLPELVRNLSESYKATQEGRLARARTEEIRKRIDREPEAAGLDEDERQELAVRIEQALSIEEKNLPAASRFTEEHVISVELEET